MITETVLQADGLSFLLGSVSPLTGPLLLILVQRLGLKFCLVVYTQQLGNETDSIRVSVR